MSLRYSTRAAILRSIVHRHVGARLQSTVGAVPEADEPAPQSQDQHLTSPQMRGLMHELANYPVEDFEQLTKVSRPLTTKEKQLDERLEDFLRRFGVENQVLKPLEENKSVAATPFTLAGGYSRYPYLAQTSADEPYSKQELFVRQMEHASHTAKLGAEIKEVYFPHTDISNPPAIEKLSISKLAAAGVHLGQSTSLWRSSTQPYIYGSYKGIHIIDLNQTLFHLKRAAKVVEGVAENGGLILFLGTREGQKPALRRAAERVRGCYVASKWIPGTLTNPIEISSVWGRHEVDFEGNPTGRELTEEENISIIKPDLIIVLNPTENRNALREAMQARVPTIGIIDTDSEPSMVTYPVPGNDDSLRSVSLLVSILAKAGERGLANRKEKLAALSE
ncbi:ABR010Cp [Eremothecium gossypii ATCC 10895]|uniref:ABR010Cp n=1 Tax=Eremothecium gossypii (strain ATCC 10895 / CBS 109.51 / FGSC 9923 / NRRL Y-1056) TaxID=284811 RepID=Q75DL1_EREGS|nr:mitochondrial 37S ribosomal protein MRP4 [Eremothecium gossypii ATCC 10895]AAS50780.2 ABR010Cp [Eremothecium gossypii ATCC 10895]AEY95069.1 FABR010Cp [Eremothecium gossypii FDAG1]